MLRSRTHRRARAAGFTLLEIMVALAAGGIALSSLYAVGAASSRHFREQQRISATQTALRSAMDVLKHDFQRAGFMSTPLATAAGESCVSTVGLVDAQNKLAAVAGYIQNDALPKNVDSKASNDSTFFSVDKVWLTGNYATSGEYPMTAVAGSATVTLSTNWQSFRRDFSRWNDKIDSTCDNEAFKAAFVANRLVRLHSTAGGFFYAAVSSAQCVDDNSATIELKTSVPASCNMTNGWIAPVNTISYMVDAATATEQGNDSHMTMLRRREVLPDSRDKLVVDVSNTAIDDRAILDNVVRFRLDFIARNPASVVTNFVPVTAADVIANPERIRGVIIDLAARTAQQEPNFFTKVVGSSYIVDSTSPGAARVRRARAELLLPNIASRRL